MRSLGAGEGPHAAAPDLRRRPAWSPRHPPTSQGRVRAPAALALVFVGLLLQGCGQARIDAVPDVACATVPSPAGGAVPVRPGDTLDVTLAFDAPPDGDALRVLVRVDPLDEPGVVRFDLIPPPTAAAVGLALTPAAFFQGCVDPAPAGFRLRAPEAPWSKGWLRVSAARPVRVRVEVGDGAGVDTRGAAAPSEPGTTRWSPEAGPLVVRQGESGEGRWRPPEPGAGS